MLCFSMVSWLRGLAKSAPKNGSCGGWAAQDVNKICTTPARESDLKVKIVKNWHVRSTFWSWTSQKLHHACARERFLRTKGTTRHVRSTFGSWVAKFSPRLRARTIRKSKSLKSDGLGTFLEVQSAFRVAGAGISTRCKIRGRRRSLWGLQKRWQAWWIWKGFEMMLFAWQAQGFRALWCQCLKSRTLNPWKGCEFHVTEIKGYFPGIISRGSYRSSYASAHLLRGRRNTFEVSASKSVKCIVILRPSVWSTCNFWRTSRRNASFSIFNTWFLKQVWQTCFVFDLQGLIFEGSLAEMFRFWSLKLHFWRRSRFWSLKLHFWRKSRKASVLIFKAWFLKEISQKCFVFVLIFKASFWKDVSQKSCDFLIFKVWFLKEASQKSFFFELQSFIFQGSLADKLCFGATFEGSPAEKLRFWASKFQFWRKPSRKKTSFLSLQASFSKEHSQKSFVFELQRFIFQGSIADKLCFGASKLHLWRKSGRKASVLSFKISILKEVVSQKTSFLSLQASFSKEDSRKSFAFLSFKASFLKEDSQTRKISDSLESQTSQLTTKSLESQIFWQPIDLNLKSFDIQITWIWNQSTSESLESQISWRPNHWNHKSIDNRIWILNQLTTKIAWIANPATTTFESWINWQHKSFESHMSWQPNHLNLRSIDNQNHLNLKSDDNQITWIWNQVTTKSFDSQLIWVWHQLTFQPFELHTPSSYRFLMVGNFRHLVR